MYMCKDQQSRGNSISSTSNVYMQITKRELPGRLTFNDYSINDTTPYDKCTQGCFLAIGCPRFMQIGSIKLGQKHW